MKLIGNQPIKIIQGDTHEYKIKFENDINELIERIVFTSKNLEIEENMEFIGDENYWRFRFSASQTDIPPSDFYSYDITIFFKDGDIISETGVPLRIIDKRNPVENLYFGE